MVKTTILLEDDLYRELVEESIKEYGSTKKLSLLINRRLRAGKPKKRFCIKPISLGRRITEKEVEEAIQKGWEDAVS